MDGSSTTDSVSRNGSDEDAVHENSPESAGLARGLARSAVPKGAGRIAVGRLPLRPDQVIATKGRIANPTRMAKIQRVARVSDRASTGFDFVEAHQEAKSEVVKKESWGRRATNFAGSLAKNTILGMAVFATYEEAIDKFAEENQEVLDWIPTAGEETRDSTRLWQHYAAGFCAGSVQAGLGSAIESVLTLIWQPLQHRFLGASSVATPNTAAATVTFVPNLLHHATSHAVLFGSYETLKRAATLALGTISTSNTHVDTNNGIEEPPSEDNGFLDGQLVAVALAGGTAGICQQFVIDVVDQVIQARKSAKKQPIGKLLTSIQPPRYSAKSLLMLSIPTSIGFVAFEYGREAVLAD